MKRINVMIVDDSALVREVLSQVVHSDPELAVCAVARDPFVAVERMREVVPDVIVLDIEMPKMDGITFLKRLMRQRPIPTVICSTLVEDGGDTALAALEAGAVELILKPAIGTKEFFEESSIRICDVIKAAAKATIAHRGLWSEPKIAIKPSAEKVVLRALAKTTDKVVAIGASTGGTEALRALLCEMPRNCPPIVIVQHMPAGFTTSFAKRLNDLSAIEVKEAEDGDQVVPGRAILARGDRHLRLNRSGARYFVNVYEAPLVSRHRPSVNVLFHSVAEIAGANAIGVILTGMGDDGADGLLAMRKAGAQTVGQDEESCVVYGMPREAFLRGAVVKQVALPQVANAVLAMAEG